MIVGTSIPHLSRRHPVWPSALLLLVAAHSALAQPATPAPAHFTSSNATDIDDADRRFLDIINDNAAAAQTRVQAARALLNDNSSSAARALVCQLLQTDILYNIQPLLTAADSLTLIPEDLALCLASCADKNQILAPQIARVLARCEGRNTLPWLVSHTAADANELTRAAARQSLLALAGPSAPDPDDHASWTDWLNRAQALTEAQWLSLRLRTMANQHAKVSQVLSSTAADLTAARRRLYLALNPAERAPLLSEWLTQSNPSGRGVALELMLRELAAGTSIDASLAQGVFPLLRSDNPSERADAARVLARLSPPDAGSALAAQLSRETESAPIDAILSALVAWPSHVTDAELEHWIEWSNPPHPAALEIALGKMRRGEINSDSLRSVVLSAARERLQSGPTPASCQLLCQYGTDADRALVSELLQDSRPAIRYAAAESLVPEPQYVIPIAVAASNDPALITLAARAFVLHAPTLDSFKLLFAMPGEAQQRIFLLSFLASVMPADQVQSAITIIGPDPSLLDRLLSTLENPNRILSESQDDTQATAIAKGLLTLAQARLELGKPDAALSALQSLPSLDIYADPAITTRTFLACWLALARIDDARAMKADADAWLDALTVIKGQPRDERQRTFDAFSIDFGPTLTTDQRARFEALQSRLNAQSPPLDTTSAAPGNDTTRDASPAPR
ncbi:MAG: hypothetical protein KGS45_07705 [Planctomycetes bacterium]|nr:hypothetical protein [Planctomycetota bacterium]